MQSQHNHRPLLNPRAAAASAVLPRQDVVSRPPQPLWLAITKLVILEFFVVAAAAHLASVIYHEALIGVWPSSHLCITANLYLAATAELISPGFGHNKSSQAPS